MRAKAAGHRVVLVIATRGENGEVAEGFLEPDEKLWERRVKEQAEACRILGVDRHEFLGYIDSGMMGTEENDVPESFWKADPEVAASRLAEILKEEDADVLTVYDEGGTYGHPDHIQVHRVGIRAAELARTPKVYELVVTRGAIESLTKRLADAGFDFGDNGDDLPPGVPDEIVTTKIDATPYVERKRAAMAAHASQISDTSFFLAMPPDLFKDVFGTETYVLRGAPEDTNESDLFEGLS